MNTIRAKVKCTEIVKREWAEMAKFSAVYSGDKNTEDNTFTQATPVLELSMQIDNPSAQGFFTPGRSYYLDFTPIA